MGAEDRRIYSIDASKNVKGFQQITSLSAAAGLTVPAFARMAIIQAETQNVRWRDDGTDPSATVGMLLASGSSITYSGDLAAIKFIEVSGSAKLNVAYYD